MSQSGSWLNYIRVVPTSWMPERIRSAGTLFPGFNRYATLDDCLKYLNAFLENVWKMGYTPRAGFAAPGMNNYGCAGWSSTGSLYFIPRSDGNTYRELWNFHLQNKDHLDMVYIGSWSDYTEGHEIEPTVQNGFRELNTTLEYASRFKGETTYDDSGIMQSYELFLLRKQAYFFDQCGINVDELKAELDVIAHKINEKNYAEAATLITQAKNTFSAVSNNILSETYLVDNSQISITGIKNAENEYVLSGSRTGITINNSELKEKLASKFYEGYLVYEYWDDTWVRNTNIVSATEREPVSTYKFIAQIKDKGVKQWLPAKIRLYKENVKYGGEPLNSDISFYGDGSQTSKIRNISYEFKIYDNKNTAVVNTPYNNATVRSNKGTLFIDTTSALDNDVSLNIYNLNGRCVYTARIADKTSQFNISKLERGVYLVVLKGKELQQNFKIIR